MKYHRHVFCNAASLHMFILQIIAERDAGKPVLPVVVDIIGPTTNPHDILGAYDLLTFHADLDITVRVMATAGLMDLAILGAVPPTHRFISKNVVFFSFGFEQFQYGSYSDLMNKAEALEAITMRIYAVIVSNLSYSNEALEEMTRDGKMIWGDEIVKRGAVSYGLRNRKEGIGADVTELEDVQHWGPGRPHWGPEPCWEPGPYWGHVEPEEGTL